MVLSWKKLIIQLQGEKLHEAASISDIDNSHEIIRKTNWLLTERSCEHQQKTSCVSNAGPALEWKAAQDRARSPVPFTNPYQLQQLSSSLPFSVRAEPLEVSEI
jgi:hypothetical protein